MKERTAWLSSWLGDVVDNDGQAFTDGVQGAAHNGAERAWLCRWPADAGAEVRAMRGVWTDLGSRYDADRPILRLRYKPTGKQITVMRAATWLGEGDYSHHQARRVMMRLDAELWHEFRTPFFSTPAAVGLDAWQRGWGDEWPVLAPELQDLIRSTSGQGRFEACPAPELEMLPALYVLDSLMRYPASAALIELGNEARHEVRPKDGWGECPCRAPVTHTPGYLGYTPARYRVRFRAPDDWGHVGLLPVRGVHGWEWPLFGYMDSVRRESWADACEVRLAIERGWHIEVLERLVFGQRADGPKTPRKPLAAWVGKLMATYDLLAGNGAWVPGANEDCELYHAAIRNIIIQTIGALAARHRTVTRTAGEGELVPDHRLAQATTREADDGLLEYEDYAMPHGSQARLQHPEFAAAVWAHARRCLLLQRHTVDGDHYETGALTLPREQVIGFALDAIYTTHNPSWLYHGKLGQYRFKHWVPGPLPAPRTYGELLRVTKGGDE